MRFVDIGAHIGCYTVTGAAAIGETGKVYAFEPHPENADLLSRNVSLNGYERRVEIVRKAVFSSTGEAVLGVDAGDTGGSSVFGGEAKALSSSVKVPTTTIDEFFATEGWPRVDLVKMDVEGAEIAVLHGMGEFCRRNPDLMLIVEFSPKRIASAGGTPELFLAAIQERGFSEVVLIDGKLSTFRVPADTPELVQKANFRERNLLCYRTREG